MEGITAVLLIALIWKIVDWAKLLLAADWIGARTQVVVWLVATLVVWLGAQANLTETLTLIGDRPLGALDVGSVILAGLLIGSGASSTVDIKKAIDGSDTARKPPLALARTGP